MRSWRRLIYFLLLNVLVSAVTTWTVVTVLLRNVPPQADQAVPTLVRQPDSAGGEIVVTQPADSSVDQTGEDMDVVSDVLEIKSVIGAGAIDTERVIVQHIGDKEVSLVGWQLQDQDGHVYSFPALTIFTGGAVTVFTRKGTSTVVELFWGQDEAIWQPGEKAFLLDPLGDVRAVYTIP